MRVIYVLNSTFINGGATKSFLAMIHGLMPMGVEPLVVTPDKEGVYQKLTEGNVRCEAITYRPATYPNGNESLKDYLLFLPRLFARIYCNRKAYKRIKQLIKEFKPDIIHSNTSVIDAGFLAAKAMHVPHIFHVREYADRDFNLHFYPTHTRYFKMLHDTATHTISITKDIHLHHNLEGCNRAHVIYNGIRPTISVMPEGSDEHYFLYAGRIEPQKGLHELLKAYNDYRKSATVPLNLKICGSAVGEAYIKEQKRFIEKNKLENHVEFLGLRNDISELMLHATATIVPSLSEGFGRVMPEAMFFGCPVIAKDTAGSHEQIINGKEVQDEPIAIAYNTTEELTHLLCHAALLGKSGLTTMRKAAFYTVNRLYSTENYVNNVFNIYKEIVSR